MKGIFLFAFQVSRLLSVHSEYANDILTVPSRTVIGDQSCLVDEFVGRTHFVKFHTASAQLCIKIDLFKNGKISVDNNNPDCDIGSFNESSTYGIYDNHVGNIAYFKKSTILGWQGQISFEENKNIEVTDVKLINYDPASKIFEIKLIFPSCNAPSVLPSSYPTSSGHLTCTIKEFAGKSYLVPFTTAQLAVCIKVDMFENGSVSVDNNNADCMNEFSKEPTIYSYYTGNHSETNAFFEKGPTGWTGVVSFEQQHSSISGGLDVEILNYNPTSKEFALSLKVESCISPSVVPSSLPIATPTYEPIITMSSSSPSRPCIPFWKKLGQDIDGKSMSDYSGYSVSLSKDGKIVAIGSLRPSGGHDLLNNISHTGHAYTNEQEGNVWVYQYDDASKNWRQMGQDVDSETGADYYGTSVVSLSEDGKIVAIGSSGTYDNGHVHVYQYDDVNGKWLQIGRNIDGEAIYDRFGWSISLSDDGTKVAIGAWGNDSTGRNAGHVRMFQYEESSNEWLQVGQDIDGEAACDFSGIRVSLSADGRIVAIGAWGNDDNGFDAGHVRVFQYEESSNKWHQMGHDIDGEGAYDNSGRHGVSLAKEGKIVAIGAYRNGDNGSNAGHVRIFQYEDVSKTWLQIGQDIDGETPGDYSGISVSLSENGTIVAIGAWGNDDNGSDAGHVRLFQYDAVVDKWLQIGQNINGEAESDKSGWSVSLSENGRIVAIGATYNDGDNFAGGHVRVYHRVCV